MSSSVLKYETAASTSLLDRGCPALRPEPAGLLPVPPLRRRVPGRRGERRDPRPVDPHDPARRHAGRPRQSARLEMPRLLHLRHPVPERHPDRAHHRDAQADGQEGPPRAAAAEGRAFHGAFVKAAGQARPVQRTGRHGDVRDAGRARRVQARRPQGGRRRGSRPRRNSARR